MSFGLAEHLARVGEETAKRIKQLEAERDAALAEVELLNKVIDGWAANDPEWGPRLRSVPRGGNQSTGE
jgi:hypothetical protein